MNFTPSMMSIGSGTLAARPVASLGVESRALFIRRTYTHLFGAIIAFAGIEVALFQTGLAEGIAEAILSVSWLVVLGAFIVVGWIATHFAFSAASLATQYLALGIYVVAESIIFVPLLYVANRHAGGAIESAAWVTMIGFSGLTLIAFWTRKDFSFLRGVLVWGGLCAVGLILAGTVFGFHLGTYFSIAMVGLAGASILYDTSNVIRRYPEDRYVGAALQLFASVALLFWYVLMIFLSRD
ncbi:MAG: Bax inhibitor-1/YccA family protein [Planctomycetota bacterium]|jgi:FtsH-binding integral membrane protein